MVNQKLIFLKMRLVLCWGVTYTERIFQMQPKYWGNTRTGHI